MTWNAAVFNKLHSIKPSLGEWHPNYRIDRQEEVTLARLKIGHTSRSETYVLLFRRRRFRRRRRRRKLFFVFRSFSRKL